MHRILGAKSGFILFDGKREYSAQHADCARSRAFTEALRHGTHEPFNVVLGDVSRTASTYQGFHVQFNPAFVPCDGACFLLGHALRQVKVAQIGNRDGLPSPCPALCRVLSCGYQTQQALGFFSRHLWRERFGFSRSWVRPRPPVLPNGDAACPSLAPANAVLGQIGPGSGWCDFQTEAENLGVPEKLIAVAGLLGVYAALRNPTGGHFSRSRAYCWSQYLR